MSEPTAEQMNCGYCLYGPPALCTCGTCPVQADDYDDDDFDDLEDEDDFEDCGLMPDGQCGLAGTEHCDFSCPNRDSDLFAGSKAWMKAHGSACHKCGAEIEDGEEPGTPRQCGNCPVAPATQEGG